MIGSDGRKLLGPRLVDVDLIRGGGQGLALALALAHQLVHPQSIACVTDNQKGEQGCERLNKQDSQ